MLLNRLWLLIQKSLRYAWRRRICFCCHNIICELVVPVLCLLFLSLLRWIHTQPTVNNATILSNRTTDSFIEINPSSIISHRSSTYVSNYTSQQRCPSLYRPIGVINKQLLNKLRKLCPKSNFILPSESSQHHGNIFINTTSTGYSISYESLFTDRAWYPTTSLLTNTEKPSKTQHPSVSICSNRDFRETDLILQDYFAIESTLNPPKSKQILSIYSWPCSSYATDSLFSIDAKFALVFILIFLDGCMLYNFNLLFYSLINEKHQGITELLRLISIPPILNSLAWFLRTFLMQLIPNIVLMIVLKISFEGAIYLPFVSIWLIIPTIILWTIQVLSRAVLVGHFFSSNLKATLWSWFIYCISFWLALSSSIELPFSFHLLASTWLPFYSIKPLFIHLFRINTDLGRNHLTGEIIIIWLCMLVGSLLMWFLAYYFEQVRPGKYGIPRPWTWPLDYVYRKRMGTTKRRESVAMQMIETTSDDDITVRVDNLTKTYGRFNTEQQVAVDHVSFNLKKSTIHGLIGHNGAGKTTTMEIMCGLLSCNSGTISIHGKDLRENLTELRKCIGYCPQHDMLFSYLTVREQLEFYARIRSQGNNVDYNQIQELLAMMDMSEYSQRLCHELSGGMQRKLSILCAFVGQANVIILDEPSSSLDPVARRTLWSWLREHKLNRTLLISSHLLDEIEELCDSIIILDSGKVRAQGTILELKKQYGPPGDRLHLDQIPAYIPKQWIVDQDAHSIQVPCRKQLISLLEELERDDIKYSLENITLDDIFLKLISPTEYNTSEENTMKSSIDTLFNAQTSTQRSKLWCQQILGVLIRRCQVFLRRARLLPIVMLLILAYALIPLCFPSFNTISMLSREHSSYIVSSSPDFIDKFPLKNLDAKVTPSLYTRQDFEQYLLGIKTWQSDYQGHNTIVGLRIPSGNHIECYVPSPISINVVKFCFPIFSSFYNHTRIPIDLVPNEKETSSLERSNQGEFSNDQAVYCDGDILTLTFTNHLSVMLLSMILIVCAALIIQDYKSGFHSYSLVHGLRSPIHWSIIFLTDLILCITWLLIVLVIARFAHPSTFNSRFFALAPLLFVVNLPFMYLIAKFFEAPILGASVIMFLLQFAHVLYALTIFTGLFRDFPTFYKIVYIMKWLLIIIFPNVNLIILMANILFPYSCPSYHSKKSLIHTFILLSQFILYFILLFVADTSQIPLLCLVRKNKTIQHDEDADVVEERHRIETMTNEEKQRKALTVDNLSKSYGFFNPPAVNRLAFAVPHGQCFGLLGFNGSGKTTTFRMLVDDLRPTSGHIFKNNKESIGYCPQDDISFSALTVLQSINYICRIHGINPSILNDLILSQFQLEEYRHRLVSRLSGGTRRRLHLALCLIGSPTLLILDEPTAKVDPMLRNQIRMILQNRPQNTSIVFASHSMLECEQLCDRLTILVHGITQCLGSIRHLKNKYGTDYRIRLTPLKMPLNIPLLTHIDNTNEYTYPKTNLSKVFKILEQLVEQNIIASNYTVQLTSLEHIFVGFQHTTDVLTKL